MLCLFVFLGGHDNFRKMIDEAEPLGYPVVVKNARGHRGRTLILLLPVIHSVHRTAHPNIHTTVNSAHPHMKFIDRVLNDYHWGAATNTKQTLIKLS